MIPLFHCVCCQNAFSTFKRFPLCHECASSLKPAPRTCPNCESTQCPPSACSTPWRKKTFQSLYLHYAPSNRSFELIRKWQWNTGPLFDRRVLIPNPSLLEWIRKISPKEIHSLPHPSPGGVRLCRWLKRFCLKQSSSKNQILLVSSLWLPKNEKILAEIEKHRLRGQVCGFFLTSRP